MHKKTEKLLELNFDFVISDIIGMQLAMLFAVLLRNDTKWMISEGIYQKAALFVGISSLFVSLFADAYTNILNRGYWKEWKKVAEYVILVVTGKTALLFLFNISGSYSRIVMFYYIILSFVMVYALRLLHKKLKIGCRIRKHLKRKSIFLIGTCQSCREMADHILDNPYSEFVLAGIGICGDDRVVPERKNHEDNALSNHDNDREEKGNLLSGKKEIKTGEKYRKVPIILGTDSILKSLSQEWVDEVFISVDSQMQEPTDIMEKCRTMGITIHQKLVSPMEQQENLRIGDVDGYTVLTSSIQNISTWEMFVKRLIDILIAIVGISITALLTIILGPLIYIASPGPIFFSQVRIGKNGRRFKIYKFRSMYMDAEARKKDLMNKNQVKSDLMFKMKDDPRIIKGIGKIIREYSLDEFPQFWNVLRNDLSLVGTRPPTEEEFKKYDYHHRMRMAVKPGITGLWQVSGRNNIKDFEKVVALDTEYIRNWNIGLDIKIIMKTVGVILRKEGAR